MKRALPPHPPDWCLISAVSSVQPSRGFAFRNLVVFGTKLVQMHDNIKKAKSFLDLIICNESALKKGFKKHTHSKRIHYCVPSAVNVIILRSFLLRLTPNFQCCLCRLFGSYLLERNMKNARTCTPTKGNPYRIRRTWNVILLPPPDWCIISAMSSVQPSPSSVSRILEERVIFSLISNVFQGVENHI